MSTTGTKPRKTPRRHAADVRFHVCNALRSLDDARAQIRDPVTRDFAGRLHTILLEARGAVEPLIDAATVEQPPGVVDRRSPVEMKLGRFLQIGQTWRCRADRRCWRVRQIHRRDCVADLEDDDGRRTSIPFEDLRHNWTWIASTTPTGGPHA